MTGLILSLLIAAAVVYAVFFLIFKVIWMIIKKQSNKWPLIWAGVCTVLFCGAAIGGAVWGVYKVMKPFSGIIERVRANPQPVYGQTVYTDPEYGFQLTVFNGMDFSGWMHFNGADVKLGIDTNVFKKDNAGKNLEEPFTLAALLRLENKPDQTSVEALEQGLKANKDRRLDVNQIRRTSIDGHPALYVSGAVYSNQGESIPVRLMAAEDGEHVYYISILEVTKDENSPALEQTVQSLRFTAQD